MISSEKDETNRKSPLRIEYKETTTRVDGNIDNTLHLPQEYDSLTKAQAVLEAWIWHTTKDKDVEEGSQVETTIDSPRITKQLGILRNQEGLDTPNYERK